jgi:hypothetical protein
MQPLAKSLPAVPSSTPSTPALTEPSGDQLRTAAVTLETLLKTRPDTGKEPPEYLAGMVQCLAWLTPEEHGWLTHPRNGLHTVCKFLPTAADVHEFLRNRRARAEQFQPAPTGWRKLEDDPTAPWNQETDAERKKRVVEELLGYNPDTVGAPAKRRVFVPPTDEDLANLKLKTPQAPLSPYLLKALRAQGYPFPKPQSDEAAA